MMAMKIIMAKEFFTLFVSNATIDQCQPVPLLNQQATHGPGTKIVGISRVGFLPDHFGNHSKHGSAIQLEVTGVDYVQVHGFKLMDITELKQVYHEDIQPFDSNAKNDYHTSVYQRKLIF